MAESDPKTPGWDNPDQAAQELTWAIRPTHSARQELRRRDSLRPGWVAFSQHGQVRSSQPGQPKPEDSLVEKASEGKRGNGGK
jgi:hypothetical protein